MDDGWMDGLQIEEDNNESILLSKTLQEKSFLNYFNALYFLSRVFRSTQTSLLLFFLKATLLKMEGGEALS